MKPFIIACDCNDLDHQIVCLPDEEEFECLFEIRLQKASLWKRIKYLFGYSIDICDIIVSSDKIPVFEKIISILKRGDDKDLWIQDYIAFQSGELNRAENLGIRWNRMTEEQKRKTIEAFELMNK